MNSANRQDDTAEVVERVVEFMRHRGGAADGASVEAMRALLLADSSADDIVAAAVEQLLGPIGRREREEESDLLSALYTDEGVGMAHSILVV